MSRPTRLTPELIEKIACHLAAIGGSVGDAAEVCGEKAKTAEEWYKRGKGEDPNRKPTPLYAAFADAIARARAQHRARCKANMAAAAQGGQIISEKHVKVETPTKSGPKITEVHETRKTAPDWKAAQETLRMEYPEMYPYPNMIRLEHELGKRATGMFASVQDELKAARLRAFDPRALPPAPVEIEVIPELEEPVERTPV